MLSVKSLFSNGFVKGSPRRSPAHHGIQLQRSIYSPKPCSLLRAFDVVPRSVTAVYLPNLVCDRPIARPHWWGGYTLFLHRQDSESGCMLQYDDENANSADWLDWLTFTYRAGAWAILLIFMSDCTTEKSSSSRDHQNTHYHGF